MKFLLNSALSFLAIATTAYAQDWPCGNCTNESPEPITAVPPPWILKATAYAFPIAPALGTLPSKAYAPLEKGSTAAQGTYLGVAGALLIVRYTDTPVGPYDEFVILPGAYGYQKKHPSGLTLPAAGIRGTRFYVSQKYTNWNGRVNWNIPKHLAQFNWTTNTDGSESLQIYPFDTENQPNEGYPSSLPFFQMTFKSFTPSIPLPINTDLFQFLGLSPLLNQAPLPAGQGSYDELPGTTEWADTALGTKSDISQLGMFDVYQGSGDKVGNTGKNAVGDEYYPNFWPGVPRLNVGIKMENAEISFPVPEKWTLP